MKLKLILALIPGIKKPECKLSEFYVLKYVPYYNKSLKNKKKPLLLKVMATFLIIISKTDCNCRF